MMSELVHTQIVYTPASQRPLSGQVDLWELAPGKQGSIAVPTSELFAPGPLQNKNKKLLITSSVCKNLSENSILSLEGLWI